MSHGFSTIKAAEINAMTAAGANLIRITVEQYHSMIGHTIMEGAPIELLDGILVLKDRSKAGESPMTIYPPHAISVTNVARLDRRLDGVTAHMRSQQPISLRPINEPEPDGTLVHGAVRRYSTEHPSPADIVCVFECSDASLLHDQTTKKRIYASHGIPVYVIVNLIDDVVEVRTGIAPRAETYSFTNILKRGESFSISLPDGTPFDIAADELLP